MKKGAHGSRILNLRAAVSLGLFATSLAATPVSAADVVAVRQQGFKRIGASQKAIVDELNKDAPDFALISSNAARIKAIAGQVPRWFPPGSGPAPGRKTSAKPQVWSDPVRFAAMTQQLQTETGAFSATVATRDSGQIRKQLRALSGACRNCHTAFRSSDD